VAVDAFDAVPMSASASNIFKLAELVKVPSVTPAAAFLMSANSISASVDKTFKVTSLETPLSVYLKT
jgi:hypothetical protein